MDQNTLHRDQRYRKECLERSSSREEMGILQLCLDKLQFANKSSCGRAVKPSSSVKEIDHHVRH